MVEAVAAIAGLVALVALGLWAGLRERGKRATAEAADQAAREALDAIKRGEEAHREWARLTPDEQWDRLSDVERD